MLPVFCIGFLSYHYIKTYLFNAKVVVLALIFGGIVMVLIDKLSSQKLKESSATPIYEEIEKISFKQAFIVGLFQIFSLWPGMSRSGSTIVGGIIAKMNYKLAADFSGTFLD